MIHELKIKPQYYEDIKIGLKPFEIRKNDRDFKLGDILILNEYDSGAGTYSGRALKSIFRAFKIPICKM